MAMPRSLPVALDGVPASVRHRAAAAAPRSAPSARLLRQLRELALEPLPGAHQLLDLGGEALLLVLELAHLVAGGALEERGIAKHLVDGVDARLGLLDGGGDLVAALADLAPALLPLAVVEDGRGGAGGGPLLLLAAHAQHGLGVEVVVAEALEILLVGAGEVLDAARRDLQHAVGELRHEPAVVGDEDQRAVIGLEPLDQRLD